MVTPAQWTLLPLPVTPDLQSEDPAAQAAASVIFLGRGLLRPFVRDEKNDFANGSGADLVRAAVGQVLGTRTSTAQTIGELPWRPEFGSLLHTLRHSNNNDMLTQIAKGFVVDALRRWEPRVRVTGFAINRRRSMPGGPEDVLEIIVRYNVIDRNVAGNNVVLGNQQAVVEYQVGVQ
jgi:phage baseplate assembly protein W